LPDKAFAFLVYLFSGFAQRPQVQGSLKPVTHITAVMFALQTMRPSEFWSPDVKPFFDLLPPGGSAADLNQFTRKSDPTRWL